MKLKSLFAFAAMTAAACAGPAMATDLSKIDRTIVKEPAYKNKPKYCLLVFGPEAKHRVWLALDGDTLYVDPDGTGNLTEKVTAEKSDRDTQGEYTFKLRQLSVGGRVHRDLRVATQKLEQFAARDERAKPLFAIDPQACTYLVMLAVDIPAWKGSGVGGRVIQVAAYADANGYLQFSDHPKDAPIIHFGGPLAIAADTLEMKAGREADFFLSVGSRGLGPGTHTATEYEGVIPEKLFPTLNVVYPPRKPGDPPVREKYHLKERC